MSETISPVSGRRYGLATVCQVWRVARSGVYRHLTSPATPPGRPGPVGPMPNAALLAAIRGVLAASPFHGEGHRKVWARPCAAGTRTSLRRVLRLMQENGLLTPTGVGQDGHGTGRRSCCSIRKLTGMAVSQNSQVSRYRAAIGIRRSFDVAKPGRKRKKSR